MSINYITPLANPTRFKTILVCIPLARHIKTKKSTFRKIIYTGFTPITRLITPLAARESAFRKISYTGFNPISMLITP